MSEITEDILIGCVKRDERCRKIIYEEYYQKMYAICLRYAGDSHEAKDMLHDGFLKLFKKVDQVDSIKLFEGWAKRLFTNHCIDHLRSAYKKYIRYSSDFDENLTESESEDRSFIYTLGDKEITVSQLMNAMNQLRPDYRIIINMYAIEGFTHQQIADKLGVKHSTSRSKLMRAREALKNNLLNKI